MVNKNRTNFQKIFVLIQEILAVAELSQSHEMGNTFCKITHHEKFATVCRNTQFLKCPCILVTLSLNLQ